MRALFFTFIMLLMALLSLFATPRAATVSSAATGAVVVDSRLATGANTAGNDGSVVTH